MKQKVMDAATTIEMWDAAGVGVGAQRIINNRFKNHFGWRFTEHENKIRNTVNIDKGTPPKFGNCTIEGKCQTYWHKNIYKVINNGLGLHLNSNPTFKCHSVDVIFGADHGQGSF